jgi:hypothetical protein
MPRSIKSWVVPAAVGLLILLAWPAAAPAQGIGGTSSQDSSVGYVDSAIPADLFRLRLDAAYNDRRPNRAEFFYPQPQPRGPGVPLPEKSVDYQDVTGYLETTLTPRLSGFVEVPWRLLNPEVNANANGLGDMNAGFKWAFLYGPDAVATFQLRTYIPTGDPGRGLGTDHVSLEPSLLLFKPFSDRLRFEGELRAWVPIGGTDFAGEVVRYGFGLSYDLFQVNCLKVVPVAELVGWTVLSGKESFVPPSGLVTVQDAAGDTIVNIKLGVRWKLGERSDLYTGYGRPLTGERWYENIVRVEFRLFF